MGLTYASVITSLFGENEFTTRDLTVLTGSSRSAKLLSELKMKGIVERMDRGRYRVLPLSERPDTRINEWERVRYIILKAPMEKAWTGSTAIELWTNGKYKISPNPYLRVFHLLVRSSELNAWKAYLKKSGVSYSGKKRVGSFVDLKSSSKVNSTLVRDEPVIPREAVMRLIREHRGLYAGADELIEY